MDKDELSRLKSVIVEGFLAYESGDPIFDAMMVWVLDRDGLYVFDPLALRQSKGGRLVSYHGSFDELVRDLDAGAEVQIYHHSTPLEGQPVLGAGMVELSLAGERAKIVKWGNWRGRYRPTWSQMGVASQELIEARMGTESTNMLKGDSGSTPMRTAGPEAINAVEAGLNEATAQESWHPFNSGDIDVPRRT
ncbi:hypothetical protein ACFCXT_19935 [Streptomyces vinaceus]|uniref:hypothetical protein n=1 Tax=Streptomyces vinaceus TaxID=1960 RepID=UPI0035DCB701